MWNNLIQSVFSYKEIWKRRFINGIIIIIKQVYSSYSSDNSVVSILPEILPLQL